MICWLAIWLPVCWSCRSWHSPPNTATDDVLMCECFGSTTGRVPSSSIVRQAVMSCDITDIIDGRECDQMWHPQNSLHLCMRLHISKHDIRNNKTVKNHNDIIFTFITGIWSRKWDNTWVKGNVLILNSMPKSLSGTRFKFTYCVISKDMFHSWHLNCLHHPLLLFLFIYIVIIYYNQI